MGTTKLKIPANDCKEFSLLRNAFQFLIHSLTPQLAMRNALAFLDQGSEFMSGPSAGRPAEETVGMGIEPRTKNKADSSFF